MRSDFKYLTDFWFMKKCRIPSDSESESVTSLIHLAVKVSEEVNRKCPARNTTVQLTSTLTMSATMHSVIDRQTDGRTDAIMMPRVNHTACGTLLYRCHYKYDCVLYRRRWWIMLVEVQLLLDNTTSFLLNSTCWLLHLKSLRSAVHVLVW